MDERKVSDSSASTLEINNSAFDTNVVKFHISFAEGSLLDAVKALNELKSIVELSKSNNSSDYEIQNEMYFNCQEKLKSQGETALTNLRTACQNGNEEEIFDQYVLVQQVGFERKAAICLVGYLRNTLKQKARGCVDSAKAQRSLGNVNEYGYIERSPHIQALDALIGNVSSVIINVSDRTVDRSHLPLIFPPIHELCVVHAVQIIDIFCEDARLSSWERRAIDHVKRMDDPTKSIESDESVQMVDLLLGELTFILQVCADYSDFYSSIKEIELTTEKYQIEFGRKIQELNGVYILLERFYLFQTIHKAIELVEPQEIEPMIYISSSVEDIMFILQKSLDRAVRSVNYQTALSVVMAMLDGLDSMFLPSIVNLPDKDICLPGVIDENEKQSTSADTNSQEDDAGSSFTDALLSAMDEDLKRPVQDEGKLILTINSACSSVELIKQLEDMITDSSSIAFPNDGKILECVPKGISEIIDDFSCVLTNGINALIDRGIGKFVLDLILVWLDEASYVLTVDDYEEADVHGLKVDVFVDKLIQHPVMKRCRKTMSQKTLQRFVQLLAERMAKKIEEFIFEKVFNDWGAMFLEREIHRLSSRMKGLMKDGDIDEQFARLNQIVLLIGVTKPKDAAEYTTLRDYLSIVDIEKCLNLRKTFRRESISYTVKEIENNS